MTDAAFRVEGAAFALFAESQSNVWDRAIGATVEHVYYGSGKIVKVLPRQNYMPLIDVLFVDGISTFNSDGFRSGFFPFVCLSDSLSADYGKWKVEDLARKAAKLAENLWQGWITDFHRQVVAMSGVASEITRPLQALTDQDKKLCLAWANRSFGESNPIPEQWEEFVDSDKNEALRMWSARSAEKIAISFFADLGKRTVDVSVHQLETAANEWRTHDIEVDGAPVDVKNARASFSSPNSYIEHTIPRLKQAHGSALDVKILGVLSDYVPWRRIRQEDFGSATILGVVCNEDLVALGSWMNKNFGDVLDFSLLRDARLETYPGWLYEYPADWYATRREAQKQIGMLLGECPDPSRAKDAIPCYVFEFFAKSHSSLTKVRTALEDELIGKLLTLRREIGLSRRTLFAWILGTILRTLIGRGGTAVHETTAALRSLLFVPYLKGAPLYPAGLYDPMTYVESLIAMSEAIAEPIEPELLRSMRFFKLTSPSILRGLLDDGVTWQTVYAHCGGWRTSPVKARCGNNPIHLGNAKICQECHCLICGECAHCKDSCSLCAARQRQYAEDHAKQGQVVQGAGDQVWQGHDDCPF